MNPSGIRPPGEKSYALRVVIPGLFSVEDAYRGNYEFFKGRPISEGYVKDENKPKESDVNDSLERPKAPSKDSR